MAKETKFYKDQKVEVVKGFFRGKIGIVTLRREEGFFFKNIKYDVYYSTTPNVSGSIFTVNESDLEVYISPEDIYTREFEKKLNEPL